MDIFPSTGKSIADLLLLCAPQNILVELELSENEIDEFCNDFEGMNGYGQTQIIALAMYYASQTQINFKKSYQLISTLYITPEVIYELTQLINAQQFAETESLLNQIGREKLSKQGKHAIETRHNQPGGYRDKKKQIQDIWASGKYKSRDECAEKEHAALGLSISSSRKALRNTPKPNQT